MPRVLVVDDNAVNRELLIEELSYRGFEVEAAASGTEALRFLERSELDVVLLDIMMPGVDGLEVLRAIRRKKALAELPVLMTTARDTRADIIEALSLGANDYITKPIDLHVLMARIRTQLALKQANDVLTRVNRQLEEAQQTILQLTAGGDAINNVEEWAHTMAAEISRLIGGTVEVILYGDEHSAEHIDAGAESRRIFIGTSPRFGELVVAAQAPWTERIRMLLLSFAGQLAATLQMRRMRAELSSAQTRVVLRQQELLDRGIALLQVCTKCGLCYDHTAKNCANDGSKLESPQVLPYRVNNRYRFTNRIGTGGMARLFAAFDEKLERHVALKIIRAEHFHDDAMRVRFEQEARAIARIEHGGVSTAYDSGQLEDGSLFFVMELLRGLNLAQMLQVHGRGTPKQVASLAKQMASALAAVHRAGFIHRDVKPDNIFLIEEQDGFRVKLLDFGIAKRVGTDTNLTQTGTFVGTPAYMAPEQVEEGEVDARTDLYATAAVLFEALAGRRLTKERDVDSVFREILHVAPPPVTSFLLEPIPALDRLFDVALAKKKDERPAAIEEWAAAVAEELDRVPPHAPGWPPTFGTGYHMPGAMDTMRHAR